jgi:hypothetical protein
MKNSELLKHLREVREAQQAIADELKGNHNPTVTPVRVKAQAIAEFCEALEDAMTGKGTGSLSTYK